MSHAGLTQVIQSVINPGDGEFIVSFTQETCQAYSAFSSANDNKICSKPLMPHVHTNGMKALEGDEIMRRVSKSAGLLQISIKLFLLFQFMRLIIEQIK